MDQGQLNSIPVKTESSLPSNEKRNEVGRQTSIRATKTISGQALRQYLQSKGSPLLGEEEQLLASPFFSTIIAISAAESTYCKHIPNEFNCWGLTPLKGEKSDGKWAKFDSFQEVMDDLNYRLPYYESLWGGLENWVGPKRYCASECSNWLRTVLKVKNEVENL